MMNELRNAMMGAAHKAQEDTEQTRMGVVTAYNPDTYCVKARVQPSGVETGWIPIKTHWVGNDWGMQAGPTVGDLVSLSHQEGDVNAAVVLGGIYNNSDRPMPVPSGELWIKHKSGSFLKFLNNGDVSVHTARDLIADVGRNVQATVAGDANIAVVGTITSSAAQWNHTGPVAINGTLSVKYQITGTGGLGITTAFGNVGGYAAQITGNMNGLNGSFVGTNWDFVADAISLKTHRTTGVATGAGISGVPTP